MAAEYPPAADHLAEAAARSGALDFGLWGFPLVLDRADHSADPSAAPGEILLVIIKAATAAAATVAAVNAAAPATAAVATVAAEAVGATAAVALAAATGVGAAAAGVVAGKWPVC